MGTRAFGQVERWMSMVTLLAQPGAGRTAAELASEFNCDPRTIYRDLKALDKLGVPLVSDQDDESTGEPGRWKLLDGWRFRAPPMEATPADVLATTAAMHALAPLLRTPWASALPALRGKLAAKLPRHVATAARAGGDGIAAGPAARPDYAPRTRLLETIRNALDARRSLRIRYFSLSRRAESERVIDPYKLWFVDDHLYLVAACHTHGGRPRTFLVDRIREATATDEAFTIPADFDWNAYIASGFRLFHGEPKRVVIHFSAEVAPLIREREWHPTQERIELPAGEVGLAMRAGGLEELARWILGFGRHARVVEPVELVLSVRREVEAMRERYAETGAAGRSSMVRVRYARRSKGQPQSE